MTDTSKPARSYAALVLEQAECLERSFTPGGEYTIDDLDEDDRAALQDAADLRELAKLVDQWREDSARWRAMTCQCPRDRMPATDEFNALIQQAGPQGRADQ
jgi:hypothetical protein